MFLCRSLIENDKTHLPEAYALMALMCLHASRSPARISKEGYLIPLAKQDRMKWDMDLISAGNSYLNKSATGKEISTYHLEAAIAYEHCTAQDFKSTNWQNIVQHYDALIERSADPVVWLNRCIVLMEFKGPEFALESLKQLKKYNSIEKNYLYHATCAEIHSRLGDKERAVAFFEKARKLTLSDKEKRFLLDKISEIKN